MSLGLHKFVCLSTGTDVLPSFPHLRNSKNQHFLVRVGNVLEVPGARR